MIFFSYPIAETRRSQKNKLSVTLGWCGRGANINELFSSHVQDILLLSLLLHRLAEESHVSVTESQVHLSGRRLLSRVWILRILLLPLVPGLSQPLLHDKEKLGFLDLLKGIDAAAPVQLSVLQVSVVGDPRLDAVEDVSPRK